PELLRWRRLWIVLAVRPVLRLVAVRAPVALHLARVRIDNGDAAIQITIGDVGFVRLRIHPDLRDASEVLEIVATLVAAITAELHQELAFFRELENVRVLRSIAADPHVAFVIDVYAVIRLRPFVTG